MSEDTKKMSRLTFYGEYNKHLSFFLQVPDFEDSFADLYPFEWKLNRSFSMGFLTLLTMSKLGSDGLSETPKVRQSATRFYNVYNNGKVKAI